MKTCFRCLRELPPNSFYVHRMMADGRLGKCKDCCKTEAAANYRKKTENPEFVMSERRRGRLKSTRQRMNGTAAKPKNETKAAWINRNPEARRAHNAVANAIRRGEMSRQPCEVCGAEPTHAHHEDYSKPLQVNWLCPTHHAMHHTIEREVAP